MLVAVGAEDCVRVTVETAATTLEDAMRIESSIVGFKNIVRFVDLFAGLEKRNNSNND